MKVEVQLSGLEGVLKTLSELPKEVVSRRGGPVRKALRKGAVVIQRQAKANLQASTSNSTADGARSTGFLLKNVIVTRGKMPPGENGELYLVRVRWKNYPERTRPQVNTHQTARYLEYGTAKQPAEPWLRPAFYAKAQEAVNVVVTELVKDIEKISQKLLKDGGA